MDPQIRVGIDVGCKAHRVGIADPKGSILEEFDISHTNAGFRDFFRRIDHHKQELDLSLGGDMTYRVHRIAVDENTAQEKLATQWPE
jgi:ribulose kinase